MAMFTVQSVTSPVYADAGHTRIHLTVKFEGFPSAMPFIATADDPEAHGRQLHANAIAGLYGTIAPYVAP